MCPLGYKCIINVWMLLTPPHTAVAVSCAGSGVWELADRSRLDTVFVRWPLRAIHTEEEYRAAALDSMRKLMCFLSIQACKPIQVVNEHFYKAVLLLLISKRSEKFSTTATNYNSSASFNNHETDFGSTSFAMSQLLFVFKHVSSL